MIDLLKLIVFKKKYKIKFKKDFTIEVYKDKFLKPSFDYEKFFYDNITYWLFDFYFFTILITDIVYKELN